VVNISNNIWRQTTPPHILDLLLLILDPLPQRLDFGEQNHKQCHVLLDSLLQRGFVAEPDSEFGDLLLELLDDGVEAADLVREEAILR
jgi:hypothetical protein